MVTGGTETLTGVEGLGSGGTEGSVVGTVPVIGPMGEFGSGIAGAAAGAATPSRPRSACVSWAGAGEWLMRTEAVSTPAATTTLACATWSMAGGRCRKKSMSRRPPINIARK
jgi:hypothetical protein